MPGKFNLIDVSGNEAAIDKIIRKVEEAIPTFNRMQQSISDVNNVLRNGTPRDYVNSLQHVAQLNRQLGQTNAALARNERELARAQRDLAQARLADARAAEVNIRTTERNERAARNNAGAYNRLRNEYRSSLNNMRDIQARLIGLENGFRNGTISQERYTRRTRELSRKLIEAAANTRRLERELDSINNRGNKGSGFSSLFKNLVGANIATDIIRKVGQEILELGNKYYETAKKIESLNLAQKTVFQDSEKVSAANEFLRESAQRYGVDLLSLTEQYTKFQSSAQGTILEGEKAKQVFDAVTKSSSLLGVTTDETQGILRALGQMMSKGKVQAEELRGQLSDRMAGAFKLFADGMGVSTATLDKMLKDGEVLAEDVLPKFADQLNKKYKLGVGEEVETMNSSINRAANAWTIFVNGIESRYGVANGIVGTLSRSFVTLMESITPSEAISAIKNEQTQLNILGVQLRQNWNDEQKRKEIIDEMISINPFFLNGLDKEKVSLEEISKRIQDVNMQYAQKIIVQENAEKIAELVKDQVIAYRNLSNVITDNSQIYNSLNTSSKNAIDQYMSGAITIEQATKRIENANKGNNQSLASASWLLQKVSDEYEHSHITSDGFVRSIRASKIAIQEASSETNNQINFLNNLIKTNGQVIYTNGQMAMSYNKLGQAMYDSRKKFTEEAYKAQVEGKKFVLHNNVWRENVNGVWKTTNRRFDTSDQSKTKGKDAGQQWDVRNINGKEQLVDINTLKSDMSKQLEAEKAAKEAKKAAAAAKKAEAERLKAEKDTVARLMALRDNELADLKYKKVVGKITEEEFLKEKLAITEKYAKQIIAVAADENGQMKKIAAAQRKKVVDEYEKTLKEINDLNVKNIERESDKNLKPLERQKNNISENQFMSETDRLKAEIDLSNKIIAETERRNNLILEENKKNFQDTTDLEISQTEKMLDLQEERNELFLKFSETAIADLETKYKLLEVDQDITYEQEVQNIHAQKGLTNAEKEYLLTIAELKAQREKNNLKKQELQDQAQAIQSSATKVTVNGIETTVLTPDQVQKLKDIQKEVKELENANVDIGISIDDESLKLFEDKWAGLKETLSQGFSDLGLENIANKIGGLFDSILMSQEEFNKKYGENAEKWKVGLQAGIAAVQDIANQLIEESTNKRISELDKQLEYAKDNSDQEIEFLQGRINQLNSLEELTAEQEADRRAMEDEQRALREQQSQREKQIEAQKVRAEQKAASQKALINGALGATMALATQAPPASYIMAALALAFGVAQSATIMSKDPVPKYFVGTDYARKGLAWTDERGAEIHTDKYGNIKDFGSSGGARLKYLNEGDKIFTAEKSKTMMTDMFKAPEMQREDYLRLAMRNIHYPLNIKNEVNIDYDLLSDKIAQKQEVIARKYTPVNTFEVEGFVYMQEPGKIPKIVDRVRRTNNSVRNAKD